MNKIREVFGCDYPMLAMLHLKGTNDEDVVSRAKKEIEIYYNSGVSAIVVENYFGNYYQMEKVLQYLEENYSDKVYGINCLNMDVLGFELAMTYKAKFVQLDSVAGHVKPRDDFSMEAFLNLYRKRANVFLLGGVRFKYQQYLSERSLEEDLLIAKDRCDAIVVTGNHTGEETNLSKIKEFRRIIGEFPMFVGAGVIPENVKEQMQYVDGAIVGSYLKKNHVDNGEVEKEYVEEMVQLFNEIRGE